MFSHLVKILVDSVWRYHRSEMTFSVAPVRMLGSVPGLTDGTNEVVDKMAKMAGETDKNKRPRVPQPSLDGIDTAFELSLR